jgi:ABC-type maltose transport system permease subunit
MKFRISIRIIIAVCVVIFGLTSLLFFRYLYRQIDEKDELILEVIETDQPSLSSLTLLKDKFEESKKLSSYMWTLNPAYDSVFSSEFNLLFGLEIPNILEKIIDQSKMWTNEEQVLLLNISDLISDSLYSLYMDESSSLNNENTNKAIFLSNEIDQILSKLIKERQTKLSSSLENLDLQRTHLKRNLLRLFLVFPFIVILFIVYLIFYLKNNLKTLESSLGDLSQGIIPKNIEIFKHSEFSKINRNINALFEYFRNLSLVSWKIAQKDFQSEFSPLSEHDQMGNNLLNLQINLKKATEAEGKRRIEDQQRNWVISGTARINDILRMSSDKLEELGYHLIKELVLYTDSKIGGLFILNQGENDKEYIEMIAAYAFDRQKFLQKKILPGEGLVGRCIQENETIYVNEVPRNYLTIKSGLGEREPVSILIVPLRLNDIAYGVIEIGSFQNIEKYKIKFVEDISDNIATTISKQKSNIQTSRLLEQTRQQAEEMVAQEEEMRQSMEELRAIQEKSAKREEKLLEEIAKLKGS